MDSEAATAAGTAEKRFSELGLSIPPSPKRMGNFASSVRAGDLLFLSGQGSHDHLGTIGADLDVDAGYEAARECALRLLGLVRDELGSLDRVRRIVKVGGFIRCVPEFDRGPLVLNGASDLLVQVFGDAGRHARSTIGAVALPHNFAVEIEMIVQVGT